jgi:hypothetical protein
MNYYLNGRAQSNGDHEVHKEGCVYMPLPENRVLIGNFNNCKDAVEEAKRKYDGIKINGCFYCANSCRTS